MVSAVERFPTYIYCANGENQMKKKKVLAIVIVLLCVLFLVVAVIAVVLGIGIKTYGPNFGLYLTPPSTTEYVEHALGRMEMGIYASGEEWSKIKEEVLNVAKSAEDYEDTYDVLNRAAHVAGGKHSRLVTTEEQKESVEAQQMPETNFENGILYIKLPPYDAQSQKADEYAGAVIAILKEHTNDCKGVIVDLRDNTGGDMGPMLAAVSPLLPDGTLMSFDIKGNQSKVELENGTVSGGGSSITVDAFKMPKVKIAVLQNEWTASSGEAVLLSFKGLSHVQTFGCSSAGYCSVNNVYRLYDGAYIQLTIGEDVDRLGNKYCEDPIPADVETDMPMEAAKEFLCGDD